MRLNRVFGPTCIKCVSYDFLSRCSQRNYHEIPTQ